MNFRIKPTLVVIDAKEKRYSRYDGVRMTNQCQSEFPLTAEQVEHFRTDPHGFYDRYEAA